MRPNIPVVGPRPIGRPTPSQIGRLRRLLSDRVSASRTSQSTPQLDESEKGRTSQSTPQLDESEKGRTQPWEWSVEEVVEWVKSEEFGQDVCDKFAGS